LIFVTGWFYRERSFLWLIKVIVPFTGKRDLASKMNGDGTEMESGCREV
jgi:hypothetical protein